MMYEVTIKVLKAVIVEVNDQHVKVNKLFGKDVDSSALKNLVEDNYSTEIFWFPYNGFPLLSNKYNSYDSQLWVKNVNITDKESLSVLEEILQDGWDYAMDRFRISTIEILRRISNSALWLTPHILSPSMVAIPNGKHFTKFPKAIHYQKFIDDILVRDFEAVFKVDDDYSNIKKAYEEAIDLIQSKLEKGIYPARIALEVRFINGSNSTLLAQCYEGKDLDPKSRYAYIEVLDFEQGKDNIPWNEYINELCGKWMKIKGFIFPHWAKEFPKDVDWKKGCKKCFW